MKKIQLKLKILIVLFVVLCLVTSVFVWKLNDSVKLVLNGETHMVIDYDSEFNDPGVAVNRFDVLVDYPVTVQGTVDTHKLGSYEITYRFQKFPITKQVVRKVDVKDLTPPVLNLRGDQTIVMYQDESFHDPGCDVDDKVDGVNSDALEVTGDVDMATAGTYTLTYTASDQAGNQNSITRTVIVEAKPVIQKGVVYLTFDDGPNDKTTGIILDILNKYNVKATFFVTGNGPDSLIARAYQEGHTIGLHTFSHQYQNVYASVDGYFNDLNKISDRVYRITNQRSTLIRFPGGSSNTVSKKYTPGIMTQLTKMVQEKGYQYFDWNVSAEDAGASPTQESIFHNVTDNLNKDRSNVVLLHDTKKMTAETLERIILYCQEHGFRMAALDAHSFPAHQPVSN